MAGARRGREIYIGLVTDDPFGPVIVFGAGGTMIELLNDRAMELPPLNQFLARRLIERSRVAETLGEWRGASAVDMDALEQVLLRVSEMVCELPQLREMDINPIIVDEHGAVAVDARIVIDSAPQAASGRSNNYHHLAILPYPARHEQVWPLRGGGQYTVRPIHPNDAQMLQGLVQHLSPESRYFRFVSSMRELPPSMLARFTLIDYDREMALVAVYKETERGARRRDRRDRAHRRRLALRDQPRPVQLRVLAGGRRRLQRQGPRLAPDGEHHGRRAREGSRRNRGPGAGEEPRHAEAHEGSGLLRSSRLRRTPTSCW